jgi:hypothetical protein
MKRTKKEINNIVEVLKCARDKKSWQYLNPSYMSSAKWIKAGPNDDVIDAIAKQGYLIRPTPR